ncbi:cyclin-like protein [Phyllosticta citribraziliensis]|uniref:Cyclin-like protein n=1 Tax=Phyllosticta citribraziliensis TaxID=989973 RepID=A0ABR1M1D2_9PEZI
MSDDQPQRPLRSLRIHNENNVPAAVPSKTLHQRNKSTPALSSVAQTGGIKAAAKRTAFADVSNTARSSKLVKDDLVAPGKQTNGKKDSGLPTVQESSSRSSAILRPAQRPVSSITHKSSAPETVSSTLPKHAEHSQPKKLGSKRNTAVFKEVVHHDAPDQDDVEEDSNVALHHQAHPTRRERSNTAPQLSPPSVKLPKVTSASEDAIEDQIARIAREESVTSIETAVAPEECQNYVTYEDESPVQEDEPVSPSLQEDDEALENQQLEHDELEEATEKAGKALLTAEDKYEEHWEEEEEEYYDADGYTTTRSLRPRTDNTTGGATIVLAPRVTARTRRRLEECKKMALKHKTQEDYEDEHWDTSMVAEYGDEIFEYMRSLEERMKPNPFYMDNQAEIQWSMRSVLMDWLVQVHHRFTLLPETLFLAVNYVDRFLSCKVVSLGKLQLVGATAIFVAAKYEEINCPSVSEIVYMVDGGYTVDEILKAERFMLSMLQFELGWPGPMSFLRRISKADDYDLETRTLAKYFLEITIMDERFVGCPPSFTAAGAHCLARMMLKKGAICKGEWGPCHVHYSGYTYDQIRPLIGVILECSEQPQKHHAAVYEKYSDKRFKRASLFVEQEIRKGFTIPDIAPRDDYEKKYGPLNTCHPPPNILRYAKKD